LLNLALQQLIGKGLMNQIFPQKSLRPTITSANPDLVTPADGSISPQKNKPVRLLRTGETEAPPRGISTGTVVFNCLTFYAQKLLLL